MENNESKKLAPLFILKILQEHSDKNHLLTQQDIIDYLDNDYAISFHRRAVSDDLALLGAQRETEIISTRCGSYLARRTFEDAEIRLLMDSILASKHINPTQTKELMGKLKDFASPSYPKSDINIHSVNEWDKTESTALFSTIDTLNEAIGQRMQVEFDYNKYGADKKLHVTSHACVSPYSLLLHNQRYYLMSHDEKHKKVYYCRVDRITNIRLTETPATDIRSLPDYKEGIDYKRFSTAMPYMFADKPERVDFLADKDILDQVIDWFGKSITIYKTDDENKYRISVISSPKAMVYWALQYCEHVEVISPVALRSEIKATLETALGRYQKDI